MIEGLSTRAKAVMGSHFGIGSEVYFALKESKPSDKMQAALSELVNYGLVSVSYGPGLRYTRNISPEESFEYFKWVGENLDHPDLQDFKVTQPI